MNIRKILSFKISQMILLIIIFSSICISYCHAESINDYETQIVENKTQINSLEEIKNQLHITAEMLRGNGFVNDALIEILGNKWIECNEHQNNLDSLNIELSNKINELKENQKRESNRKFVGNFKLTHYCSCAKCNGSYGNKTALGTSLTPYRTIAVDPKVIPLGSKVEIQGKLYVAEDTGGAIKGNRIDICVSSHSEAYKKGVLKNIPVYIINE